MTLGFIGLVSVLVGALIAYRSRLVQSRQTFAGTSMTAASITTIEAAFLRDGDAAVAQVREAARFLDQHLPDAAEPAQIEDALIVRGFVFPRELQRRLDRARSAALLLLGGATFAALLAAGMFDRGPDGTRLGFGLLVVAVVAAVAILTITTPPRRTAAGDAALGMRRSAYPLELVAKAHPLEALALYGGRLRRPGENAAAAPSSPKP